MARSVCISDKQQVVGSVTMSQIFHGIYSFISDPRVPEPEGRWVFYQKSTLQFALHLQLCPVLPTRDRVLVSLCG